MTTLTITRGLPGAGKSTYARAFVAAEPDTTARVNRDDTRTMLYGKRTGLTFEQEAHVTSVVHSTAKALLTRGMDVIADDTNLRPRYVREWRKLAASVGADFHTVEFTFPSLDDLIARDKAREHSVGEDVLRTLWGKFTRNGTLLPVPDEDEPPALRPYEAAPGTPPAVIVDIDGTLARMAGRGPYDLHRVHEDEPIQPIIDLVDVFRNDGYRVIFMSGREDSCRDATEEWLGRHLGFQGIPDLEPLFMRAADDKRRDSIVKAELFDRHVRDRYDVRYVLDDRNQVVQMWRDMGLTCLQVAPGDF